MATHLVRCPACRAPLELPVTLLGTPVRCGGCQHLFTAPPPAPTPRRATPIPVPAAPPPGPARPSRYKDRAPRDDDEDDAPPRKPRPRARKGSPGLVIAAVGAGVVFGLVLIGGVGYLLFGRADREPAPVAPVAAAEVAAPPADPAGGKEMTAEVLRRVKAATVRVDVVLGRGEEGTGTGFLVHPEGLIVTNAHVVGYSRKEGNRPARAVKVVFNCGEAGQRVAAAQVYGVDGDGDLAVLRVAPDGLPEVLPLGSSAGLRETQELFVFGFPLGDIVGKKITVSTTTVSSLRRENGVLTAVQVNGGMHPGNSGGPLTDRAGQVVGVAVAGIRGTTINFAIPADQVDHFVREQIAAGGRVKPATVVAQPPEEADQPPFLPPTLLRPPGVHRPPSRLGPRR